MKKRVQEYYEDVKLGKVIFQKPETTEEKDKNPENEKNHDPEEPKKKGKKK